MDAVNVRLAWLALLSIACSTGPRPVAPAEPGARAAPQAAATAVVSTRSDDESLLSDFRDLANGDVSPAALDFFISQNPRLLTATAKPYGPALEWVLQFDGEQAALALLRAGVPVVSLEKDDAGPLATAAAHGMDNVVKELLKRGAPVDTLGYWGTPLHGAASGGHASTIRLLIAAGAKPTVHAEDHEFTALHQAMHERHVDAIRALIAAKADLDAPDDDGQTALHWGALAYTPQAVHIYRKLSLPHDTVFRDPGRAEAMEILIKAGAKVDIQDLEGNTPLHSAARLRSIRAAEMLLAHGAKKTVRNGLGETPLMIALETKEQEMIALLK